MYQGHSINPYKNMEGQEILCVNV